MITTENIYFLFLQRMKLTFISYSYTELNFRERTKGVYLKKN